jgi:cyclase
MIDVVSRTADQIFIPLTVGGGVRTIEDMRDLLAAGTDKVSINTAAINDPSLITRGADHFGRQFIVVAIDARRQPDGTWAVYTHGGRRKTDLDAVEWANRAAELGAGELLVTSMDRDGTRDGYDVALLEAISAAVNIPVIASGGAGTLAHFSEALAPGRADAALAASLFHFGELRIADLKQYLAGQQIPVRLTT